MRMQMIGWEGGLRRLHGRRWTPGAVLLALVLGLAALVLAVTLLALALAGAIVLGGAYLGYRVLRAAIVRGQGGPSRRRVQRVARDARGLLEMARTPDPLERYLIAVREFDRISAAALAVDPVDLPRRSTARRAVDLAEQALNLHDAVAEIERQVAADARADGALANVWELSVATADLCSYCRDVRDARHSLTLGEARAFISRRTFLLGRRDALVGRLRDAQLRRPAHTSEESGVRSVP